LLFISPDQRSNICFGCQTSEYLIGISEKAGYRKEPFISIKKLSRTGSAIVESRITRAVMR
jgi:hypothetical protein